MLWRRSFSTDDWKAESVSMAWYQVLGIAVSRTDKTPLGMDSVIIGMVISFSKLSGLMVVSEAGTARAAVAKIRVARALYGMVMGFVRRLMMMVEVGLYLMSFW